MNDVLLQNASIIAGLMLAAWLISLALKDVSIVDIVWGLGFPLVAWASWLSEKTWGRPPLLPLLATVWGLRLSAYLAWRRIGSPEDYRYADMRKRHPRWFPLLSLFAVFALQGAVMWVVALPLQTVDPMGAPSLAWTIIGVALWSAGFLFESVGDWQLAQFKSDRGNAGRVMDRGLWRYTRHPNYFGDFLVWWGLCFLSLAAGGVWWSLIGPVLMSFLLLKVSGVSLLEVSLKSSKQGYSEYAARTSAFLPWPPKPTQPGSKK